MAGHHINFVDFHFALQLRRWRLGSQTVAQLLRHRLRVGWAQAQLQGDLPVGEVQAHEVEAQHPHAQRLVVTGQHGAGEVVEAALARLAAVALPAGLGVVVAVPDHRVAVATWAAHALGPALLTHDGEALGVVQQAGEVDQVGCGHGGQGSSREPVSYATTSPSRQTL